MTKQDLEEKIKNNTFANSCAECPYHNQILVNCGADKLIWCPYINSKFHSAFTNAKIPKKCPYKVLRKHDKELINNICKKIEQELEDNTYLYFEMRKSTSEHNSGMEYEWFNYVRFRDFTKKMLEKENEQ